MIWIWMENKDSSATDDPARAPFLASVAAACASATNFVDHGVHPSLPNYIRATSGSTQGITDDRGPGAHPLRVNNLFRQVRESGQKALSYEESMPTPCALESTRDYAVRHNPAAYYADSTDRAACRRDDVSFDHFGADVAADRLPAFAFITPDTCNDMHDCSVTVGDRWLRDTIGSITSSEAYQRESTIVFIVFDESEASGKTPFYAIAPGVPDGLQMTTELDHASLLAFTEDALGIEEHLGDAATASSLADALDGP